MSHGIRISRAEIQAITKGGSEHWSFGVVNRVVSQKDVADQGHSPGEFITSRGPLVS